MLVRRIAVHALEIKEDHPMLSPAALISNLPFLRRIVPSILRRYAKLFKPRYSIESRMGALFLIDQKNSVDRNLLIKGTWEPRQLAELEKQILAAKSPGQHNVFLDIGAHGALYSILLKSKGLVDRLIAFEPEPTNLIQLKANLFINQMIDDIEVIDKAASGEVGTIPFFVAYEGNRGGSRMSEQGEDILEKRIDVQAAPIDDMVDIKDALVIAKIDVEGSELVVLAGMLSTIKNNRCLFQIESFDDRFEDLKQWMEDHGCRHLSTVDFDHFFIKD